MAASWLLQAVCVSLLCGVSQSLWSLGQGVDDDTVVVSTQYGAVRGKVNSAGSPVAAFLGIPFAKPPLGKLRFKKPAIPDSWSDIRDAYDFSKQCLQSYYAPAGGSTKDFSEDCLYLNIFSPNTKAISTSSKTPVMVWIHGGGYTTGSASLAQYNGSLLSQKGVIVVAINYRLDMFGFMTTGDDVMPGNYGMMDQIAALKWVRDNIANFGGDPNKVTIFGESAGGSSVSLLTLSPLAKGLFHRAIMESGAALGTWAFQHPGNKVSGRQNAIRVANSPEVMCGADADNSTKLLECLQNVDAEKLLNASIKVTIDINANSGYIIGPRVETTFGFLPDLPQNIMSSGQFNHVDTIQGFNADESGIFIGFGYGMNVNMSTMSTMTPTQVADSIMSFWLRQLNDKDRDEMFNLLKTIYIGDRKLDVQTALRQALQSQNDIAWVGPALYQLEKVASRASEKNHFLYQFDYCPSMDPFCSQLSSVHGEEIAFVFGDFGYIKIRQPASQQLNVTSQDLAVMDQMMEMWTNFAKTGDPTITVPVGGAAWRPYTTGSHNYLLIGNKTESKIWPTPAVPKAFDVYLQKLEGVQGPVVG